MGGCAVCARVGTQFAQRCVVRTCAFIYSPTQQLISCTHTAKQKHLRTHSVPTCLRPSLLLWVIRQANQHTLTHRKNSNKTQRCSSLCAQTCLTFGLGPRGLRTSIPPQQRGLSLGLLAPTGSLPGAHLLSLCALCMKLSHVQGAACWVTHTYTHTYTRTSLTRQWNRTGGQTVDTSPEPQWCPSFSFSLLFPISYLL